MLRRRARPELPQVAWLAAPGGGNTSPMEPTPAKLELTRQTGWFGRWARGGFPVMVDGHEVARVGHDETVTMEVAPGLHRVWVRTRGRRGRSNDLAIDLRPGSATRLTVTSQFGFAINNGLPGTKTRPESVLKLTVD
jgi:hypothetical protein